MNQISTPQNAIAAAMSHFLVTVTFDYQPLDGDSFNYYEVFHTLAETAEQAKFNVHKKLFEVFSAYVSDDVIRNLSLIDNFLENESTNGLDEQTKEIYKQIAKMRDFYSCIPYKNGRINYECFYEEDTTEKYATVGEPTLISEEVYLATKDCIPYFDTDLIFPLSGKRIA